MSIAISIVMSVKGTSFLLKTRLIAVSMLGDCLIGILEMVHGLAMLGKPI